jgi:hypothetical protein
MIVRNVLAARRASAGIALLVRDPGEYRPDH